MVFQVPSLTFGEFAAQAPLRSFLPKDGVDSRESLREPGIDNRYINRAYPKEREAWEKNMGERAAYRQLNKSIRQQQDAAEIAVLEKKRAAIVFPKKCPSKAASTVNEKVIRAVQQHARF